MLTEPSFGQYAGSKQQANPFATAQPMGVNYGVLLRTALNGRPLEASAGAETGGASRPISKSDHYSPLSGDISGPSLSLVAGYG
jgi:hypothetical protein